MRKEERKMNENDLLLQQVKDLLNGKTQEQSINISELPYLIEQFEAKIKDDEKAKRTIKHYKRVINSLYLDMEKQDKETMTKQDVIKYKEKLNEIFEKTTTNNYITTINAFLKFCNKKEMCVKLYKVQQKQSLKKVLEESEYKRLIRWAKNHDYEIYLIIRFYATSGARADELKFLTVEALKQSNYIKVVNKGKERKVILINSLRSELKKYCSENNITSGYIFTQKKDKTKPASKVTVWRHMRKVAGNARGIDLEKIHAHSFRHLFAIKWIESGYDIAELKDILGHSSIDTTTIYTRTTDEMKRKKMQNMKL